MVGPHRIASGGDDSLRQFPANVSVDAYRLSVGNNELLAWQDASIYTRLDDIPDLTCNSSTARVLGSDIICGAIDTACVAQAVALGEFQAPSMIAPTDMPFS